MKSNIKLNPTLKTILKVQNSLSNNPQTIKQISQRLGLNYAVTCAVISYLVEIDKCILKTTDQNITFVTSKSRDILVTNSGYD